MANPNAETAWTFYNLTKDFGTLIVAIIVGGVAVVQWRLARRKLMLDLFKTRFDVYEELRAAIRHIVGSGKNTFDTDIAFNTAHQRAGFLFGKDVMGRLDETRTALASIYESQMSERVSKKDAEHFKVVTRLQADLQKIVSKYLTFHERF